jgi:hypothetical protein
MLQRRNQNRIVSLTTTSGEKLETNEDIERELVSHFQQLLAEPTEQREEEIQK